MRLTYDSRATAPSSVHTTTQLAPSPSAKVSSSAAANADDSNGGSSGSTGSRLSRYSRSPPSYFQRRVTPLFSSVSVISVPGSSTALLRSSRSSSSTGTCAVSKYFGFGHTVTRVPVALFVPLADIDFSGCVTSPSPNPMVCILPSRQTVTSRRDASALVTETPTPCRPPENEYAPPARLSNLPPACSRVNTISTTGAFSSGCRPTGMPRPSSSTVTDPSLCSVTSIRLPEPARISSDALSITSCTACKGLSVRVYMPGRCLTGSSPFSTRIDASPYSAARRLEDVFCFSCMAWLYMWKRNGKLSPVSVEKTGAGTRKPAPLLAPVGLFSC